MNTIRKDLNTWGKLFAVVVALALMVITPVLIRSSQTVLAQEGSEPGDYRSAHSGIWNAASTWEIWDGDSWESATAWPGQDVGDDYTVTIQSNHVISDNNAGTLYFGDLIIYGHLELSSNLYLASTSYVLVDGIDYDGSNITTGGSIRWLANVTLCLPENAALNVVNVKYLSGESVGQVIEGLGLHGPHADNNNMRLRIGDVDYAAAVGGGNVVYTFDEINAAGGCLAAVPTAYPVEFNYEGSTSQFTTTLAGGATGLGSDPEYTTFTWTGSGPDAFSFSYSGQNPGQVDVGHSAGMYTYTLTVTSTYRDFTYSTSQNAIVTVHHADLFITAFDQSKVYGDESFSLNQTEFSVAGLKEGDTVTGVILNSNGVNTGAAIGEYDIKPAAAVGDGLENYNIHYVNGTLSVIKPTLTITAMDQNKEYGDHTFTLDQTEYSITGLKEGDTVIGVTLTSEGTAVTATVTGSPYAIVASNALGSGLDNYTISYIDGTLTVDPRTLTVTADSTSKIYGDTFTFAGDEFTSEGLVNSDAIASVTLTSDGAAAEATVDGVPYAIVASDATGSGLDNYTISYIDGTLTVDPRRLTVTADSTSKIYGDMVTFAGDEFTSGGLVNSDTIASVTLTSDGAAADATVDGAPYNIVASDATGSGLANYAISYIDGTLSIIPLPVQVTCDAQSKACGDPDPELTYSCTDMVGDDTLTIDLTREAGEDAGNYAITYEGMLTLSSNYVVDYTGAELTIEPVTIQVTAYSQSKNYGEVDPVLTYSYYPELLGNDTFTGELTRMTGEDAGTYTITQGTLGLGENYILEYVEANLTVIGIPATFEISNMVVSTSTEETWGGITFTRKTNEDVRITVDVTNTGEMSGTYQGVLKLNGEAVSSEDINLDGGESGQLTFNLSDLPTGDYTVEIETQSGEFSTDNWTNWWLICTLILTVVFIAYLVKRYALESEF